MDVLRLWIPHVQQLSTVRVETRVHDRVFATDEQLWHRLVDALLVDLERSSAVGNEDHRLSVGGPVERKILAVVQGESFRLGDASGSFDLGNVNIRLRRSRQIGGQAAGVQKALAELAADCFVMCGRR